MDRNIMQLNNNGRNITEEEKVRLKKVYANRHLFLGIILFIIGAVSSIYMLGVIVKKEGGVKVYSQDYKLGGICVAVAIIGACFIGETIKRFSILNKFKVMQINIDKIISKNNYDGFKYVAVFQLNYNGTVLKLEVPVLSDVKEHIENTKQGKLFYIERKGYIVDKI